MPVKWRRELVMLFQPEESHPYSDEKYPYRMTFCYVMEKSPVSIKALVWMVIAIMAGLAIGQLH